MSAKGTGAAIRFLREHVSYDGGECLIWPFSRDRDGYGQFGHHGRKTLKAHRWMCEAANGPPPSPNHLAAHECGNGHLGCIHPKHLAWKTGDQNAKDRVTHGRSRKEKGRSNRKLTHAQVLRIIELKGVKSPDELSREFGVSNRQIRLIHQGKSWKGGLPHKTGTKNEIHYSLIGNKRKGWT